MVFLGGIRATLVGTKKEKRNKAISLSKIWKLAKLGLDLVVSELWNQGGQKGDPKLMEAPSKE